MSIRVAGVLTMEMCVNLEYQSLELLHKLLMVERQALRRPLLQRPHIRRQMYLDEPSWLCYNREWFGSGNTPREAYTEMLKHRLGVINGTVPSSDSLNRVLQDSS